MRTSLILICLTILTACSLPRGAALQSEVTKSSNLEDAPFAVYQVSRETVAQFAQWPHWHGYSSWVGSTHGPKSPIINSGDVLDLVIWDNSENSLLLTQGAKVVDMEGIKVGTDGSVFIPYLDKIYLKGKSPDAARALIQDRLSEILPSAQVQLNYTAGNSSSVSLVGGVSAPGLFPLPDRNLSVLKLIALGGGVSAGMRNPTVKLVRDGRTFESFLSHLYNDASLDVVLKGGDKVIVEQDDRYFQALGASGREELVYYTKDSINALEAMSIVGGITDSRADPKGILILREYPSSYISKTGKGPSKSDVVFTIDLTTADGLFSARRFYIQPEDVVLVTESPITKAQTIFSLIGGLFGLANSATALAN